jgi:hypothetical protein
MRQFRFPAGFGRLAFAALLAVLTVQPFPVAAQDDPFAPPAAQADRVTQEIPAAPTASHAQTAIIKVTDDSGRALTLHTFCLSHDGKILAGVGAGPGQIRVYDADGSPVASWDTSIKPEAINVGPDGTVYVAGSGKLQKLDAKGHLLLEKPTPHAQGGKELEEKLRQQVIDQHKQQLEAYANYPAMFRQQIAKFEEAIKQIDEKGEDDRTAADENRRKLLEQQIEQYAQSLKRYEEMAAQQSKEMTEEQLQQRIKMMLDMKTRISSISATATEVFLACPALEGYGFEVWRMNAKFEEPGQDHHGSARLLRADGRASRSGRRVRRRECALPRVPLRPRRRNEMRVGQPPARGNRRLRQLLQSDERGVRPGRRSLYRRIDHRPDQTLQPGRRVARIDRQRGHRAGLQEGDDRRQPGRQPGVHAGHDPIPHCRDVEKSGTRGERHGRKLTPNEESGFCVQNGKPRIPYADVHVRRARGATDKDVRRTRGKPRQA